MSPVEIIDELAEYTPQWFLRLIADGALGLLYFLPSTIALVCYAWACFWVVHKGITLLEEFALKTIASRSLIASPLGALQGRLRFYLFRLPAYLLDLGIGLPMFYVANLILSGGPGDIESIRQLVSNYMWQAKVLDQLPLCSPINQMGTSAGVSVAQLAIIAVFLGWTFFYHASGFDFLRRVRAVGDAILGEVTGAIPDAPPTMSQVLVALRKRGWEIEACKSAAYFLQFMHARLTVHNEAVQARTPHQYGLFKTLIETSVVGVLTALHPVVAGLYVAARYADTSKVYEAFKRCNEEFARLPANIRAALLQKYPEPPLIQNGWVGQGQGKV